LQSEKRQMTEVHKAALILSDKLNRHQLDEHACEQLLAMVGFINSADFRNALEVHKGLTTTHWSSDKEWLKGVKCLIQLCQKKFAGAS